MDRLDVILTLMRQKNLKNYLEIGVENGHIFFRIKSTFKVAVDSKFLFDFSRRLGKALINPYNFNNQYFEKTSDAFFAQDAQRVFTAKKLQLALIGGTREYQFALRSVENTLRYMQENGVIVVHGCNPQVADAAGRFEDGEGGEWNGDVWRTIIHLRSQRSDLTVFVLDIDQGLGIVTRQKPDTMLAFTPARIQALTYTELVHNRQTWLNLKPAAYFYEYFGLL